MKLRSGRGLALSVTILSILVFGLPVHAGGAETGSAQTSDDPPPPGGPPPRGHRPPPEAYKACEGKRAGTTARFATPRGDVVKGVCREMNGEMVLVPDFGKNGKGPRPEKGEEK